MDDIKLKDRLEFLAKKFEVFENSLPEIKKLIIEKQKLGFLVEEVRDSNDNLLALTFLTNTESNENKRIQMNVCVSLDIFSNMIAADPTPNKSCVQWMLNVFTRFIKERTSNGILSAVRFVVEDLPLANEYIKIFEANKRKKRFLTLSFESYSARGIKDPTDINQFKSLSQLYDVVDPFIEKDTSEMENFLIKFKSIGQAEIPVKDRKFTLYIPKSLDASVVFQPFANWCTAKSGNGMFKRYTDDLTPEGKKSNLFIIINNDFFKGESDEIYQIHFETGQIKDKSNSSNVSIFENIISKSEALSNYFYEYLIRLAKKCSTGLDNNKYLDALISFGFCESLFEMLETETPVIRFMTREVPKLPNLDRFQNVDQIIITEAKLVELHKSIGSLPNLQMLVLSRNKIKELPKEIGNLKKLEFLNLKGNPITNFPDELKYLDKSNGGSLLRLVVDRVEIGEDNYKKLQRLLPTTLL